MTLKYTPKYKTQLAPHFNLLGVDNSQWDITKCMGENGLVVLFICNHCPYVKSIQNAMIQDALILQKMGINVVAVMSNDPKYYPEDSFENMQKVATDLQYPFPYLIDSTQAVAKAYGAVCTPDIFAMDNKYVIHYRGRLNAAGISQPAQDLRQDLVAAMHEMLATGKVDSEQFPAMGCSIKWSQQD